MHSMLTVALKAARRAGRVLIQHFDRLDRLPTEEKSPFDWVTQADKDAEHAVIDVLQKAYPQHGIVSEEGGNVHSDSEFCWVIDPLDGTLNFMKGVPHFCISMALLHQEKPMHALIYDPIRQELFTASTGQGAQLNHHRMRVSQTSELSHALWSQAAPSPRTAPNVFVEHKKAVEQLLPKLGGLRYFGSAALDLAYVAAGRLDCFLGTGLRSWDMAAGHLLIRESGGVLMTPEGDMATHTAPQLIASNAKLSAGLKACFQ